MMRRVFPVMIGMLLLHGCKKEEEPPPPVDTGTTSPPATVVTPVGTPQWIVSDLVLFAGPEDVSTATCLLEGPHVWDGTVWSPGEAHEGYSTELTSGLARCGLVEKETFASSDLQNGSAIWLGLILEPGPGGAPGSSPDFPMGTVINFDRFPIVVDADVRKNGLIVDLDNDLSFPGPDTWGFVVTGLSHVPLLFWTTEARMPLGAAPEGEFEWDVSLRDATSINQETGYELTVPYQVVADGTE